MLATGAGAVEAGPVDVTALCFQSTGAGSRIGFEMKMYLDEDADTAFAFVRYATSKRWIPLVQGDRKATSYGEGVPEDVVTTWLEISGNAISGRYVMDSQGAIINAFTYTSARTGKTFDFERTRPAGEGDRCPPGS